MSAKSLLFVQDLRVSFRSGDRHVTAVRGVSFDVKPGEVLALAGESGSGKSTIAHSILKLLPQTASITANSLSFDGENILTGDGPTLRRLRGGRIGMIFQEPMSALNPLHCAGRQVAECVMTHQQVSHEAARASALDWLTRVGLRDALARYDALPHQLSGGERQRVMIAMALINNPSLLIADEPTTALDVTVQAQILDLLRALRKDLNLSILLISHDLKLVRELADRAVILKDGEAIESGVPADLFAAAQHPYTRALAAAHAVPLAARATSDGTPTIAAKKLSVTVPILKGWLRLARGRKTLVRDISLLVRPGRTLGIVGESGSGKTTLGLALLRLMDSEGAILFGGTDIQVLRGRELRGLRRQMQIVFQDPFSSLSPRMSISDIVSEGLRAHEPALSSQERMQRATEAMTKVQLAEDLLRRYPHELSGGQRQRVAIARAMILNPKFVVLDEPTSALDAQTQAHVLDLLKSLQTEFGLAYAFISHDLAAVRAMSDDILVLKDGIAVEAGPTASVLSAPQTEYTRALLAAATHYSLVPS